MAALPIIQVSVPNDFDAQIVQVSSSLVSVDEQGHLACDVGEGHLDCAGKYSSGGALESVDDHLGYSLVISDDIVVASDIRGSKLVSRVAE